MGKFSKWAAIVLVVVGVLLGLAMLYGTLVTNPKVAAELVDDPIGARAARVMLLTLPDGQQLPVNYLQEGDLVFVGADGGWWRQFEPSGAGVRLLIQGVRYFGKARVVLDNPDYTAEIFARLRPIAPRWLPAWLNGKLIVIEISTRPSGLH